MLNDTLLAALAADASPAIARLAETLPGYAANEVFNFLEETDVESVRAARLRCYADALLARSEAS